MGKKIPVQWQVTAESGSMADPMLALHLLAESWDIELENGPSPHSHNTPDSGGSTLF